MGLNSRLTLGAVAVLSFLAAAFATGDASAAGMDADLAETGDGPNGYDGVRAEVDKLAGILSLSAGDARVLKRLMLVQAYSESRGNRQAANKSNTERVASKKMYESRGNAAALSTATGVPQGAAWYTPGSGGWFGLMPTTLVNLVKGRDARGSGLGPHSNTDAWASVVMYAVYLDRLRRRPEWANSSQDAYALKAGGAAGSLMDDPHKERYKKASSNLDKAVSALGIPAAFKVNRIPAARIFGGRDWLAVYEAGR